MNAAQDAFFSLFKTRARPEARAAFEKVLTDPVSEATAILEQIAL